MARTTLSSQRPNQDAAALLRMLAEAQKRPELAEGLDGTWRREQISALVRDIFRKRNSPIELHEMLLLPRLQRSGECTRKLDHSLVGDWRKLLPNKSSVSISQCKSLLHKLVLPDRPAIVKHRQCHDGWRVGERGHRQRRLSTFVIRSFITI